MHGNKKADWNHAQGNTKVVICPTLREKNGLAMSSRNLRLNTDERKIAAELYSTL